MYILPLSQLVLLFPYFFQYRPKTVSHLYKALLCKLAFSSFWCCVFIVLIVKMEGWREADHFLSHVSKRAFNRRAFVPWGCDLVLIVIEYPSTLAANCSCLCSNIPLFSSERFLVVEVVEVVLLLQLLEQATVDQLLSPSDDNSWPLQTGEKLRQEILTTANEPALIVF